MPLELPAVCTWWIAFASGYSRARSGRASRRSDPPASPPSRRTPARAWRAPRAWCRAAGTLPCRARARLSGRSRGPGSSRSDPPRWPRAALCCERERERVEVLAREPLERGDEVGADALRDLDDVLRRSMLLPSMPPPSEPIGHARHALDAAGDDQRLLARHHAHGGEVRPPGAPSRRSGSAVTPPTSWASRRVEHGVAGDVRALLVDLRTRTPRPRRRRASGRTQPSSRGPEGPARGCVGDARPRARPCLPCLAHGGYERSRR